jgi:hypothetical protein
MDIDDGGGSGPPVGGGAIFTCSMTCPYFAFNSGSEADE